MVDMILALAILTVLHQLQLTNMVLTCLIQKNSTSSSLELLEMELLMIQRYEALELLPVSSIFID